MKLLLFSDLHCDAKAAESLVAKAHDVDVVVGAGDFANMRHGIRDTICVLQRITRPCVLVPGNGESYEELVEACADWDSAHVLHGSGVSLESVPFFGLGGAVPGDPFGSWSYDLSEDKARAHLSLCPEQAVLVSHSPPKGVVDVSSAGKSLGSTAVLHTIQRTQPRLVVCGHIHDCGGMTGQLDRCPVVNAGKLGVVLTI